MRLPALLFALAATTGVAATGGAATVALAEDCPALPGAGSLGDALSLLEPDRAAASEAGPSLLTTGREVSLAADNRLVPSFEAPCGLRVGQAFLNDRLQIDLASPFQGASDPSQATDDDDDGPFGGPVMARLGLDLAPGQALDWSLETTFVSSPSETGDSMETHVGLNNQVALFDQRLLASFDVGLSYDEEGDAFGYATGYHLDAELWRSEGFGLSAFADYDLTSLGYADEAVDATADRSAWSLGTALQWGRASLDLAYDKEHDNATGDGEVATRSWRSWSGRIGFDLSGLSPWLPDDVSFGQERTQTFDDGPADDGLDETADSLELSLTWIHGGGETSLSFEAAETHDHAGDDDSQSRAVSLRRTLDRDDWSLTAGAGLWQELSQGDDGGEAWQQLDLDLALAFDLGPGETLGFESGLSLAEGDERAGIGFEGLLFELSYDLRF